MPTSRVAVGAALSVDNNDPDWLLDPLPFKSPKKLVLQYLLLLKY